MLTCMQSFKVLIQFMVFLPLLVIQPDKEIRSKSLWRWYISTTIMSLDKGQETFLFSTASRSLLEPIQPPILWAPRVLPQGVKWPGSKAVHWPPFSDKIMNAWTYISTSPYIFMAWCIIKYRTTSTICTSASWQYATYGFLFRSYMSTVLTMPKEDYNSVVVYQAT
jgi:hypothetical protein